jgi:valyl-tRNA synthetase
VADKWILSRLQQTAADTVSAIEGYRFDQAANAIYEFTWDDYCSWYLELSKPVLNSETASEAAKRGTRQTLVRVLEALLRLAHPIMPYITEEIWQKVAPLAGVGGETVMLQPYPVSDQALIDSAAVTEMNWVMRFILGIRSIKGEMNIAPGKPVPVLLADTDASDRRNVEVHRAYLDFLARVESIEILPPGEQGPESATALIGNMKILIPLAGLIDKQAELARLDKEMGKLTAEIRRIEGKLSNSNFVDKAPEAVVQKEQDKLAEAQSALQNLAGQAEKIRAL